MVSKRPNRIIGLMNNNKEKNWAGKVGSSSFLCFCFFLLFTNITKLDYN